MSRAAITLPKPILKQSGPSTPIGTPCHSAPKHAHFPPEEVYRRISGIEYDRSPIVVIQNECALPARGCPGRTFDGTEVELHHHRHSSKKSSRSSEGDQMTNAGNHVHPNYFAAAAAAAAAAQGAATSMNMPVDLRHYPLVASSGPMPSLSMIHGDTSDSDGEVSSPFSDPDGPPTLLPESFSRKATIGDETRRLRKAEAQPTGAQRASSVKAHGHHGNRLHRTIDFQPPSPSSTFASYPGSGSCLGGF